MKYLFIFYFFTFYCCLNPLVFAQGELNKTIFIEYLKLQKEFYAESCPPGSEQKFKILDRNYRGDGNFIPTSLNEKVDLKTIKDLIPVIEEKDVWIKEQILFLKKVKSFENVHILLDQIEHDLALLQESKKEYYFTPNNIINHFRRLSILEKASKQFGELLKTVEQLKNQVPFLLSFKFPVDHLALRFEYEKFKQSSSEEARARANAIYLFRRIVQDGSYDKDLVKNDAAIRSVFDTLYLSLTKDKNRIMNDRSFLTENERVDFNFIIKNFDKLVSSRVENLEDRFQEWQARNERALSFYQDLVNGKKIKNSQNIQIKDVTDILEERARSLYTLKDFVLSREAKTYEYWSTKSDLMQSLYVIETILYGEVGRLDAPDALERRDIAQIIINRSSNSDYNFLSDKDSIVKYFSNKNSIKTENQKWLNVLFKEGEFSFSYFYIPGNYHIYCPDMTKVGQFLRHENVRIALELLSHQRINFAGIRYFSRTSMFGRIEMDSLWNKFISLPEVPGLPVKNGHKIYNFFKQSNYKFLYSFVDEDRKKNYFVIDVKGRTYVVDAGNNKLIYYHRNPQQFKYFMLLN